MPATTAMGSTWPSLKYLWNGVAKSVSIELGWMNELGASGLHVYSSGMAAMAKAPIARCCCDDMPLEGNEVPKRRAKLIYP